MLVVDEITAKRQSRFLAREQTRARVRNFIQETVEHAEIVDPLRDTVLNPERQRGRPMTVTLLEQVLTRLSPNFRFEVAPNPTKKRLFYVLPDGSESFVCLYENHVMPEWSVQHARYEWIADPDADALPPAKNRRPSIDSERLLRLIDQKGEDGAAREVLMQRPVDLAQNPGFRKVLVADREAIRGWRTVLAHVLRSGYIRLHDVETAIANVSMTGSSNRLSWAVVSGHAVNAPKVF